MAEQDNLEELDDDLNDDLGDESDGFEEDDLDDGLEGDVNEALPARLIRLLKDRRIQIGIGGALGVIVLIVSVWTIFFKEKPKPGLSNRSALEATLNQEKLAKEIAKKKSEKKKNRKKVKYASLYKQLTRKQLAEIIRELSYNDIMFEIEQTGKQFEVLVDEEEMEEAKRILAIKGLPSEAAKGFEIFDEASNLGVTEFDKRIRLIRALSGELERSIMELDAIDMAQVEIVIPEPRLFAVTQPPVTASILLRKKLDAMISDDIVYSIIQLASNSVENLQPENISVVDTNGRLLSSGVIERMAEQRRQEQMSVRYDSQGNMVSTPGNGKVVVPTVDDIVDWFEVKNGYERLLETKANGQLIGVLPEGSYKVAVTIDMKSLKKNAAPEIRRIVASIVVDSAREDIVLDEYTRNQIRNAIAGAIGFVEGRDELVLSRAAFVESDITAPKSLEEGATVAVEEKEVPKEVSKKRPSPIRLIKYWPIFLMGASILSFALGLIAAFKFVYYKVVGPKEIIRAEEGIEIIPAEELEADLPVEDDLSMQDEQIETLRELALSDPQVLADQISKWMVEETVLNE